MRELLVRLFVLLAAFLVAGAAPARDADWQAFKDGFVDTDGRVITVADGWRGPFDQRRFLRAAATGACRWFGVVLTPDTDRLHQDHIHLDLGPWRRCDA